MLRISEKYTEIRCKTYIHQKTASNIARKKSVKKICLVSVSRCPINVLKVINCSNEAAAPKVPMTYGTPFLPVSVSLFFRPPSTPFSSFMTGRPDPLTGLPALRLASKSPGWPPRPPAGPPDPPAVIYICKCLRLFFSPFGFWEMDMFPFFPYCLTFDL